MAQFRTFSHHLNIEKGRYKNIPENERTCPYCPESVENEEHFLIYCIKYSEQRSDLYTCVNQMSKSFNNLSNNDKLTYIMSNEDSLLIEALAKFINKSMEIRSSSSK